MPKMGVRPWQATVSSAGQECPPVVSSGDQAAATHSHSIRCPGCEIPAVRLVGSMDSLFKAHPRPLAGFTSLPTEIGDQSL